MGTRNLAKWFSDEVNDMDHIAAIFVALTDGNSTDLNTKPYDALSSIWYTLSSHIFKSTDVMHRRRLCNMWLENRKGLRDKYYAIAQATPNTPKLAKGIREPDNDSFRCFCEKKITWNKKVNMIKCDNCSSYYHEFCVRRGQTGNASSFVCARCKGDPLVPPVFMLTPEQSSMVNRRLSTLSQASQLLSKESQINDNEEFSFKHHPRNLDEELERTDEVGGYSTDSLAVDSSTSEKRRDEDAINMADESNSGQHLEIIEISDISDVQGDATNDAKDKNKLPAAQKGFGTKVKKIFQEKILGKTSIKKEKKPRTVEEMENLVDQLKIKHKAQTNTEQLIEEKSDMVKNEKITEEKLTDTLVEDGPHIESDDVKSFHSQNFEMYPSDVEFDKISDNLSENDDEGSYDKIPSDVINDYSDDEEHKNKNQQHSNRHQDDYGSLDDDQSGDEKDSVSTDNEGLKGNESDEKASRRKFKPFGITIENDKWKKIMDVKDKIVELDDGKSKNVVFHAINNKNFHDTLYTEFNKVWPSCILTTTKTEIKQPNQLINSRAAYLRVYADCNRKPACTAKFVFTLPTIPKDNDDNVEFLIRKTSGTVAHCTNDKATRQIRGEKRDILKKRLQNEYPSTIRTEAFAAADVEKLQQGNFTDIPKLKVMQNIRGESAKEFRLSPDDFYDLLLTSQNMETDFGKRVKGYIQSLSAKPFRVILFTESCLRAFRLVNTQKSGACLFFDATSTIVMPLKPPHDTHRPFLYTLLLKGYEKHKPVAICEMITTNQTSYNISVMLRDFFYSYEYMFVDKRKYFGISQVETDFSKAIISAVLRALENSSTEEYLMKLWKKMKDPSQDEDVLGLHVCRFHFHGFFSKYLKVVMKGKEMYAEQIRLWTAWSHRLVAMKDLWTFHRLVEDVSIILSDKFYSDEVKSRVEKIDKRTNREGVPFWRDFDAVVNEDSPLWLRIPFGYYADNVFMRIVDKRRSRSKIYSVRNPYKSHTFLKYLMRNILPYAPILSHSIFQIKGIPIVHDTQGHVENYFGQQKHERMHGNKARTMGDFVRKQAVHTKGECTRFLVELASAAKNEDRNAKTPTNLPGQRNQGHETGLNSDVSKKGNTSKSLFKFPGTAAKLGTKSSEGIAAHKSLASSKKKSLKRAEHLQDLIQKRRGSLENIFAKFKSTAEESETKKPTNWKSAECLLEGPAKTTKEQKGVKFWQSSIKNFFGSTEKQETVMKTDINVENKIRDQNEDTDSSDNVIPQPRQPKERKGKKISPEFAEERFKPEARRRGARVPASFLTLMVRIPWGGTFKRGEIVYRFSNTCPLDNFLQIFYALYEHTDKGRRYIDNISQPVGKVLIESIGYIREEKFATAKAHWLLNTSSSRNPLEKYLTMDGKLDLYECQSELAWSKIYSCFPLVETSWCETKNCPSNEQRSTKVVLVDSLIRNHIKETINLFNAPYQAASRCNLCGEKAREKILGFLDPCPDVLFYECQGWNILRGEPGNTNTVVSTCLEEDMILEQNFGGVLYDVFAYTMKDNNRDHFITVFVENGRKILYDGLHTNTFDLYKWDFSICVVVLVKR